MNRTALLGALLSCLVSQPQSSAIAQERQAAEPPVLAQSAYATDLESEVVAVFEHAFGFNPLTEDRLRVINQKEAAVRGLGAFASAVRAGKLAVEYPTNAAYERELVRQLDALLESAAGTDVAAALYHVFRESIEQQNEDKRYWLKRLEEMNEISDALSDYQEHLRDKAGQLAVRSRAKPDDEGADGHEPGRVRANLKALGPGAGRDTGLECDSIPCGAARARPLTKGEINAEIATIEADRETVRNRRQMAATQLENANKIAGQYISMLSRVLRTTDENRKGIIRNMR